MSRRRVALVVDSGAVLEARATAGLVVVPMGVVIGNTPVDGGDDGDVYRLLRRGERVSTSTPSPGDYLAAFDRLAADFESIVCLTIPQRWSGTRASAGIAADLFAAERTATSIDVVDTNTAAVGYGLVARVADALSETGADRETVLARVRLASDEVRMYGALETLEHVARSGRVPALVAGVSDALRVRPVFAMQGGGTARVGLARTEGGVLRALERVARERLDPARSHWLLLFHADNADLVALLRERLLGACTVARADTVALSPVIGVYTGPGAVGFGAVPVDPSELPAAAP